tara:strand:+ start:63 stop:470 length:408 start_codon:yes stop_codon:yes gene_type:complete
MNTEGIDFFFSHRGQLIFGQALQTAKEVMSNQEPSMLREYSNMKDMDYLLEKFPMATAFAQAKTMHPLKRWYEVRMCLSGDTIHKYDFNVYNGIVAQAVATAHTEHGMGCEAFLVGEGHDKKPYEIKLLPSDEEE